MAIFALCHQRSGFYGRCDSLDLCGKREKIFLIGHPIMRNSRESPAMRFGNSPACQDVVYDLAMNGYELEFCCTHVYPQPPSDFCWPDKNATGWDYRRAIKDWAKKRGIKDYVIVRNTCYVQDLHGIVYECWTKN